MALVNYFTVWFLLALMPLTIVALLLQDKPLALGLALAALLIAARFAPNLRSPPAVTAGSHQVSVMTFNVHKRNMNTEAVIDAILSEDADIVALQETTQELSANLSHALADRYPYNTLGGGPFAEGQAMLSRFPLTPLSPSPDYRYQKVRIESPIGAFTVLNVHTPTLFPIGWREDWEQQREFVRVLAQEAVRVTGPLLVMGDFNTTPQSENYGILSQVLKDAFAERGSGFGMTYPASPKLGIRLPWALVRIDYIFCSTQFSPIDVHVIARNGGSDHFPVVGRLDLGQE